MIYKSNLTKYSLSKKLKRLPHINITITLIKKCSWVLPLFVLLHCLSCYCKVSTSFLWVLIFSVVFVSSNVFSSRDDGLFLRLLLLRRDSHIDGLKKSISFCFLITYGVCKNRKYCFLRKSIVLHVENMFL